MKYPMNTPQIVWLSIQSLGILGSFYQLGKDKKGTDCAARITFVLINNSILYWGGFFS